MTEFLKHLPPEFWLRNQQAEEAYQQPLGGLLPIPSLANTLTRRPQLEMERWRAPNPFGGDEHAAATLGEASREGDWLRALGATGAIAMGALPSAKGRPITVYHGSPVRGIKEFRAGTSFANDPKEAAWYAMRDGVTYRTAINPDGFVRWRHPDTSLEDVVAMNRAVQLAKDSGAPGFIAENFPGANGSRYTQYIALDPSRARLEGIHDAQ